MYHPGEYAFDILSPGIPDTPNATRVTSVYNKVKKHHAPIYIEVSKKPYGEYNFSAYLIDPENMEDPIRIGSAAVKSLPLSGSAESLFAPTSCNYLELINCQNEQFKFTGYRLIMAILEYFKNEEQGRMVLETFGSSDGFYRKLGFQSVNHQEKETPFNMYFSDEVRQHRLRLIQENPLWVNQAVNEFEEKVRQVSISKTDKIFDTGE